VPPALGRAPKPGKKGPGPRRPTPAGRTTNLGAHRHQPSSLELDPDSPPTSARNASSSRRRGTTRFTSIPAWTRAATTAARGVPSSFAPTHPFAPPAPPPTPPPPTTPPP